MSGSAGITGWAQIRGACVRGLDHAHAGEPGQDAAAVAYQGDEILLTVADGVGSHTTSQFAAAIATQEVASLVFNGEKHRNPRRRLREAYRRAAATITREINYGRDPGSTTLVSALLRIVNNTIEVDLAAVGDSAVWKLCADGTLEELLCEHGERTRSLPRTVENIVTAQILLSPGDVLILCSDGFTEALNHPDGKYQRYIGDHWKSPPQEIDFAADVMFDADFLYDDRTALAAWSHK
ncbi:protein phosphatase 2C domain-containing protein [Nonomuraea polychroma]|uniref:protein phosphatase 2C domain-containing protein n=1 Tax=Nonomuraea polychroma TaxID=46176 RepID=UPI003D8C3ED0